MVSHSPQHRVLDDRLISDMAGQCKLSRREFLDLARCPMSKDDYLAHLILAGFVSSMD